MDDVSITLTQREARIVFRAFAALASAAMADPDAVTVPDADGSHSMIQPAEVRDLTLRLFGAAHQITPAQAYQVYAALLYGQDKASNDD